MVGVALPRAGGSPRRSGASRSSISSSEAATFAPPGLGDLEAGEQLAALDPEEIGDRAGPPEVDQGRVDPVLQRRAVLDQVEAKAGELALLSHPGSGSQIAGTRSRWESIASTWSRSGRSCRRAAPGPSPSGRRRSRPTSRPARGCRGRSWRRSSTRSPRRRARGGPRRSGGRAFSASRRRAGRRAGRGARPSSASRQTSRRFRLRSSPACNI